MTLFYLYRLKVELSPNSPLFRVGSRSRGEIIRSTIERKPAMEVRKGQFWRIGNIQLLEPNAIFFALGKITKSTRQLYDESSGDFIQKSFDEAPHTYVIVDLELQLCAIAHKSKIAPRVINIAKNFEKLLNAAHQEEIDRQIVLTLSEISDPEEFLKLIRNAIRVSTFEISFTPPNPFDVNQQFQKPMEELLSATDAKKGKTAITGDELNTRILEDLTRSAASAGNSANARIQSDIESKPTLKRLEGNPVTVPVEELATDEEKRDLLAKVREVYSRVRGADR